MTQPHTTSVPVTIITTVGEPDPLVRAIANLATELRPGIPRSIAESLANEALDAAADQILDETWAQQRADTYPAAVDQAHDRHTLPYEYRRAREYATARTPRPGDRHGPPDQCRCTTHAGA